MEYLSKLKDNKSVKYLNLSNCRINNTHIKILSDAIASKKNWVFDASAFYKRQKLKRQKLGFLKYNIAIINLFFAFECSPCSHLLEILFEQVNNNNALKKLIEIIETYNTINDFGTHDSTNLDKMPVEHLRNLLTKNSCTRIFWPSSDIYNVKQLKFTCLYYGIMIKILLII